MISGGDHLEWPTELESDKEMEMEQAFDKAMWEWTLEQGPPQDDDIVWLIDAAWRIGFKEGQGKTSVDEAERKLVNL